MDKRFLAILAALVILFVGIFAFSQKKDNSGQQKSGASGPVTNHIEGQGKTGVKLVEYGDYQCPVCEVYYNPLKEVVNRFSQDIYFQFSNLPLVAVHPNAFAAARAAEAAGLQGKYWQMHDQLYEHQSQWTPSKSPLSLFKNYAQAIGLDVPRFTSDYASSQVNNSINADLSAFKKTGQDQATPTFFLDGKYIDNKTLTGPDGQPSVDKFAEVINTEIAKKAAR